MGPYEPIHTLPAGRPDDPRPGVADAMFRMAVRDRPAQTVLGRRLEFEKRHPQVRITPSSQTQSGVWEAHWAGMSENEHPSHDTCAGLLDYLEARFDRGDLCGAYDDPQENPNHP